MQAATANPYDTLEYPGFPFEQTHPGRLATLATLFGLEPAAVESCRVLELGCGDGGNLIPMAVELPGSRFTGIELAQRPAEKGRQVIRALGLGNIELLTLDLRKVERDFGAFDYIIAHGLYSWIPADARGWLLDICARNLAARGIAYVSYLVYPGAHLNAALREIMLYHTRAEDEPRERVRKARELLAQLAAAPAKSDMDSPWAGECRKLLARRDGSLGHDELSAVYEPVHFHEFAREASLRGLQYLAEADFLDNIEIRPAPAGAGIQEVRQHDGIVAREQYLDFFRFRRFRQTLLCHREAAIDRTPGPARIAKLYAASPARSVSGGPDSPGTVERFEGLRGAAVETAHPLTRAVMRQLGSAWPQAVSVSRLEAELPAGDDGAAALAGILWTTFQAGLTELHAGPFRLTGEPGVRPLASPLARLQAAGGDLVTNLRHQAIRIEDEFSARFLALLDGTRDRAALLRLVSAMPEVRGNLTGVSRQLEECLKGLGRLALLLE